MGTEALEIVHPDPLANLPLVAVAYRLPAHDDEDTPALALLDLILGAGESSRLNRALVREQQTALQAQTLTMPRRMAGTTMLIAIANQGASADELKQQLHAEVDRVLQEGLILPIFLPRTLFRVLTQEGLMPSSPSFILLLH